LHYDENLTEIPLLPFTLGTVAQNQLVDMRRVGPGQLRFTFEEILPPFLTGRLVGFPLQALVADSSRKVPFYITDVDIKGCPVEFTLVPDSTLICQCYRSLEVELESLPPVEAQQEILLPLRIRGGLETVLPLQAWLSLAVPAELDDVDILPGDLFADGDVTWLREADRIDIAVPAPVFPMDTAGVLAYLRIGPNTGQKVRVVTLRVLESDLWQRCCPLEGDDPAITILQDGNCEFLLRRVKPGVEVENAPNPFTSSDGGSTHIVFRIPAAEDGRHFTLDVLDSQGRLLDRMFDGTLTEGEHRLRFSAADLPAGVYHAVLRSGDMVVTRSMLYVR
jgi:hypothetical protein